MRSRRYALAFGASAALHLLLFTSAFPFTDARTRPPDRAIAVVLVAPPDDPQFPGLQRFERRDERPPGSRDGLKPLTLEGVSIDVKTIAARRHLLFPVLTPGLAIDSFFPRADLLAVPLPAIHSADAATQSGGRPLVLDERAVRSLVDRSWARRGRWQAFQIIAKLMSTHASGGSLPRVLRAYRAENALQPYADRDVRDPRLWTQLALAADHVSFIGFIRTYAASHGSTEDASELLLLLDTIVQAEQDALRVLLDTNPAADLSVTRMSNPGAYALLLQIRQEYRGELSRRGLASNGQIDAYYDNVRLTLLQRAIDHAPNGYGANDARFLIGAICWRGGRRSEALTAWRRLTARADGTYATSSTALRLAVATSRVDDREIDRILKNETGRWLSFSYDRLRRFGYRFDSY